jgi:hypothetical protein
VWLDGRFYSLNALKERRDPVTLTSAMDVSGAGQIAANGYEQIGRLSERYTANVLVPIELGPDLQGTPGRVKVRSSRRAGGRLYRVQGTLLVKNAGTETARESLAEVRVASDAGTDRLRRETRTIAVPSLAPGEERRLRFELVFTGPVDGSVVQIYLDAKNRVAETNETNNLLAVPIRGTS